MLARVIDINGVTPEPAGKYSDFTAQVPVGVKVPDGPYACNWFPGFMLS
jgi:hypothetical protein